MNRAEPRGRPTKRHPADGRTLPVQKTGFSEFFVALSPQEQQELIDRTEYDT